MHSIRLMLMEYLKRFISKIALSEIGGLNHPVFTCPVWNITTKHPNTNINSYTTTNLTSLLNVYGGFCPDESLIQPRDLLPPLNPAITNCRQTIKPFSQCKNNCPGGNEKIKTANVLYLI